MKSRSIPAGTRLESERQEASRAAGERLDAMLTTAPAKRRRKVGAE
jgi:hypothetical protein